MFKRKKSPVTPVGELNDLLSATPAERSELIGRLGEREAKALLAYLLAKQR